MKHSITGAFAALPLWPLVTTVASLFATAGCGQIADQETVGQAPAAIQAEAPRQADARRQAEGASKGTRPNCEAPQGHCDCEHGAEPAVDDAAPVEDVRVGSSPSRGPAAAPITIVLFADFECPFCKVSESRLAELEQSYPGKLRVVFKNSPLPIHKSAKVAAKAALAAGEQGKFWEYHEALFEHQGALDRASLDRYASDLGLDMDRFGQAMSSPALDAAIEADIAEAKRLDVRGTPTFFINGRRVRGARPTEVFRPVIDRALASR